MSVPTCDANAEYISTANTCICKPGYAGDGLTCTNINECSTLAHNCDSNASCADTDGSYTCTCNTGYTGNGVTCLDFNECLGANSCSAQATCSNTIGRFTNVEDNIYVICQIIHKMNHVIIFTDIILTKLFKMKP